MSYPLKVLVIEAHPDEAEMYTGGTMRRLADRGVAVKFMSLTNGDAGHYEMDRDPLKRRRAREAYTAARHLGVLDYEILDIHDGELMPDLALRTAVISSIRRWQADVVITFHDDCPGHLDNRNAGKVVREVRDQGTSFLRALQTSHARRLRRVGSDLPPDPHPGAESGRRFLGREDLVADGNLEIARYGQPRRDSHRGFVRAVCRQGDPQPFCLLCGRFPSVWTEEAQGGERIRAPAEVVVERFLHLPHR